MSVDTRRIFSTNNLRTIAVWLYYSRTGTEKKIEQKDICQDKINNLLEYLFY